MNLQVRVKPGAHRDGLWREGDGLFAQIRTVRQDDEANEYLIRFLAGSLRVSHDLITLARGHRTTTKLVSIEIPESDLRPVLDSLPEISRAGLFDDQ